MYILEIREVPQPTNIPSLRSLLAITLFGLFCLCLCFVGMLFKRINQKSKIGHSGIVTKPIPPAFYFYPCICND